ncbi:MAG: 2-hydroxyacyl-CoA dehydratase family protein [Promethearchaeota archaeon]
MNKIGIIDSGVCAPEEIILAAGLIPVRLLGDPTINVTKANEHIPPNHCVWAKNLLEQAIKGLESGIIGIISIHGCDCTNREFDIWLEQINLDFMYFSNVPLKRDDIALKFFVNEIKELITQLEEKFNIKITEENLRDAIKLTNKIRALLREISEFRKSMNIKGSEFHELVKMVQQQDKNEVIRVLEDKLQQLKNKEPSLEKKKKILLTGSVIDDTEFFKFLENLGFQVVIDDLCIGSRYFVNSIDESMKPIKAIANYHLKKPIYSTKIPSLERFSTLKELAEKYNVDGVINIAQKFCEPILYDHPFMNKKFKEIGLPYLFVELDYNRESYKQLSTRFEAFAEMI